MTKKKSSKYQKPTIKSSALKKIQFYSRTNYPNSGEGEYLMALATAC